MASRLYELVDEYRLISGKKFEDLDCSDEFSDEKLKKFINKIISDHGFSKASDLAELSSELKASSRNGATPDREPSYEGQVSNAISANIAQRFAKGGAGAGRRGKVVDTSSAWPQKCYMIHGEKTRYYGKFTRHFSKLFNDAYQDYGKFKTKQFEFIKQQAEL